MLILEHKDDLTCPQMQCDARGRIIDDVARAILAWPESCEGIIEPLILHKGACDDARLESSMELVTALKHLAHNLCFRRCPRTDAETDLQGARSRVALRPPAGADGDR
jgi:hypothetical protein